jgi:hypothetical protein
MTSLQCTLASEETQTTYEFRPDETKKSAFWLDEVEEKGVVREVAAPAECRIECMPTPLTSASSQELYVGGFQLVSNAKMIEVYLNDDQYLTTCRGIPSGEHRPEGGSDGVAPNTTIYYKAVFAVPGGPRSVRNVVLRLRSLAPKDQQVARLVMMKLTARLAPDAADSQRATATSSGETATVVGASLPTSPDTQPSPVAAPSLITDASVASTSHSAEAGRPSDVVDVQAAMMGLSLMLKGTEDRVVRSTADKVCRELKPCFAAMQAQLQSLAAAMTNQLIPIHAAMAQQQQLIESQQAMLLRLAEQQSELKKLLLQRQGDSAATHTGETALGQVEPAVVDSERETDRVTFDRGTSGGDDDDAHGDVKVDGSAKHQEDTDTTPNESTKIPTTESEESHRLNACDDSPETSLDDVLTEAFPVVASDDGAEATHTPSPKATTPMNMRTLDLMDDADDDPFGECANGPSPPPSP